MSWFDPAIIAAFFQVILIDLTMAGDNVVVVALVAARVATEDRTRVVAWGIAAATLMRIGFALLASLFLNVIGLTLAGGLLLLWVAWKLYRELRAGSMDPATNTGGSRPALSPISAMIRIVVADLSMSLDNVLAVAGTARQHLGVLVAGLMLSVALMGVGSTVVLRILERFPWLSWLGLAVITEVAAVMIWDGGFQVERTAALLKLF